jgi:hypothetical protein
MSAMKSATMSATTNTNLPRKAAISPRNLVGRPLAGLRLDGVFGKGEESLLDDRQAVHDEHRHDHDVGGDQPADEEIEATRRGRQQAEGSDVAR